MLTDTLHQNCVHSRAQMEPPLRASTLLSTQGRPATPSRRSWACARPLPPVCLAAAACSGARAGDCVREGAAQSSGPHQGAGCRERTMAQRASREGVRPGALHCVCVLRVHNSSLRTQAHTHTHTRMHLHTTNTHALALKLTHTHTHHAPYTAPGWPPAAPPLPPHLGPAQPGCW